MSTADEYPYIVDAEAAELKLKRSFSLAGSYLIDCGIGPSIQDDAGDETLTTIWSLIPLENLEGIDREAFPSEGSRAWAALQYHPQIDPEKATFELRADWSEDEDEDRRTLHISSACITRSQREGTTTSSNAELVAVLSRLIAQSALVKVATRMNVSADESLAVIFSSEHSSISLTVSHSELEKLQSDSTNWNAPDDRSVDDDNNSNIVRTLFADLEPSRSEIVEIVNGQGLRLGYVPRRLVHQHNLLHRGIGVLVTRDRPIRSVSYSDDLHQQQQQQPDLYCHRRTDDKRIFPSMYDMFVGGVSLANEPAAVTARREVAEELGLTAALTSIAETYCGNDTLNSSPKPKHKQLSKRLLQCVVCTAYNRCVVDLFSYTCDTRSESVTWQPEEVAWGAFVPYETVEASADRSIQRLVEIQEWPGRYPPVQSKRRGEIEREGGAQHFHDETIRGWRSWDFVPDGLLVWEAWLKAAK